MSEEHKKYLKKIKVNKCLIIITRIIIVISIILIWQISADKKWINTFIYSSPKEIIKTIIKLYIDRSLTHHIFMTFYEVFLSFIIGTTLGLISSAILWRYKFLAKVLDPFLTVLNSLPKVSLGPIIIIIFGATTKSIIIMALFISVITTIINIYQYFINTDPNKIKLMKSFKATKKQIFTKLILPSNFKNIISVCKVNLSLTFIGAVLT